MSCSELHRLCSLCRSPGIATGLGPIFLREREVGERGGRPYLLDVSVLKNVSGRLSIHAGPLIARRKNRRRLKKCVFIGARDRR